LTAINIACPYYRKPKTADRDRESADMREYDLVDRPIRPADLP
jgi:hypothetical protein